MTVAELHKILDDENKTISLEEYQEILYQLKNDTIYFATQVETKQHYYNGETNAFQIALDLSEHINPNQKVIECLKEVLEMGYKLDQKQWFDYVCNKIKELEGEKE